MELVVWESGAARDALAYIFLPMDLFNVNEFVFCILTGCLL
ncbi:MAG: hypothetical protein VX693_03835 [Pseudomonadota bacterium]|nr:hypothetical protein [Pseudomonadota bacterium]